MFLEYIGKEARINMSLPTGTVTFLFTDIQGSTHLWQNNPHQMKEALERHDAILKAYINSCTRIFPSNSPL